MSKVVLTLKLNKKSKTTLVLNLRGDFSASAIEKELKLRHPWWYKNKDRITKGILEP